MTESYIDVVVRVRIPQSRVTGIGDASTQVQNLMDATIKRGVPTYWNAAAFCDFTIVRAEAIEVPRATV